MSFVSYAQNFEDVMLRRALGPLGRGFYIDIGAWSPDVDSVTRAFYESGWRGINVEPNPEFNRQLRERRPSDINLCLAVGDRAATLTMNFLGSPGLSTLDDAIAEQHLQQGWSLDRQPVQVTTLTDIWRRHVPDGQAVHFLKVDVEGFEDAVLRGNDWTTNRAWVVVVEATLPMSQVESHAVWEPILLEAGYQCVYADGLNRFYVAGEHAELIPAFRYPPNVFDDFILSGQHRAEARSAELESGLRQAEAKSAELESGLRQAEARGAALEADLRQAEARGAALEADLRQAEARGAALEADLRQAEVLGAQLETRAAQAEAAASQTRQQLQAVYASASWRITAPLRAVWERVLAVSSLRQRIKSMNNPHPIDSEPVSVDRLLSIEDPTEFVEQAYWAVLGRAPDPSGGDYYRWRIEAGFGRPFVIAALHASDEARARRAPRLPGLGLAPLVYILWRYGRGAGLSEPARWVNLAYDWWRQRRLAFTRPPIARRSGSESDRSRADSHSAPPFRLEESAQIARLRRALRDAARLPNDP